MKKIIVVLGLILCPLWAHAENPQLANVKFSGTSAGTVTFSGTYSSYSGTGKLALCEAMCVVKDTCEGWSYKWSTSQCYMYSAVTISSSGMTNDLSYDSGVITR